jgi:hypothetical protein
MSTVQHFASCGCRPTGGYRRFPPNTLFDGCTEYWQLRAVLQLYSPVTNDLIDLRADLGLPLRVQDHGHNEQCRRVSDGEHVYRAQNPNYALGLFLILE